MPVHWDNFYTPFLDGVANPYSDTATVNYLASQGVKVIQPQQYMDKWRLDRSGVHVIDNSAAKRALGFSSARTLKDAYKGAFRIGAALSPAVVSGTDSITQRIVARQFNTITAENVMKQATINPEPGVFNFAPGDSFVAFGQRNGMFIVGHTLVWHNSTPAWFFLDKDGKPNAPAAQLERLREYIQATAGHYAGRVHAWDVVNEVVAEDGGYRPTTWVRAVGNGDTLVKYAFKYAQQSAPNTELYYNEFNAWRPAKRDGIMRLVRMLKKEGIRIDGVGMQGH
jgi:endo-1,4-beta-xylanase